jgi:hypothetical protein
VNSYTPTIGVCSACKSVDAIVTTASNSSCKDTIYILPLLPGTQGALVGNSSLTMSTCSNVSVLTWILDTQATTGTPTSSDAFGNRWNYTIAQLYSFGLPRNAYESGSQAPFFAHQCSFYFCVKGYFASSSLSETVRSRVSATAEESRLVLDDKKKRWWTFDDLPPELNAAPGAIFRANDAFRGNLGYMMSSVLTGSGGYRDEKSAGRRTSSILIPEALADMFYTANGSLANLTALVEGVAEQLTTSMRTTGAQPAPDPRYAPVVAYPPPVVGVRWAWLAYPLALLLGAFVFLGATMYQTSRLPVQPWRGHLLVQLLTQLDESILVKARGGLTYRTGLDDRPGALRVRLYSTAAMASRFAVLTVSWNAVPGDHVSTRSR